MGQIMPKAQTLAAKIEAYQQLGTRHANEGQFEKAITTYSSLISLYKISRQPEKIPAAYNEIGNAYSDLGNNEAAFTTYQKALKLCPSQDLSLKAKIHKNIGAVFLSWKNLNQALHYYNLAEELAKAAQDTITTADILNNKGTVYEQQQKHHEAFFVYNQALDLYKKADLAPRIALTYNNLAILSKVTKDLKSAAAYYKQSVKYADQSGNAWLTAAISTNLGNLLSEMGNTAESEVYLNKALQISRSIKANELIYETLENLATNAARQKDYQKAFAFHQQFALARNEFINEENTKEVTRLQTVYEATKKEKDLANSKSAYLQSQMQLTRKNNLLVYAGLGLAAIISLAIFLYVHARNRQRQMRAENEFNLQLADAQARNKLQEEKLRISRELHDNIGSQLTYITSSIQNLNSTQPDLSLLPETQKIAQNTMSELRRTVWFINKQEVGLDEFAMKVQDYFKPLQALHATTLLQVAFEGDATMPSMTATNVFRIIQEGVNNALKYAQASRIEVTMQGNGNQLALQISDNGVGFNLFVDRDGYGLKNMNARSSEVNGTCSIQTVEGQGTKISVTVPV
ncbi:tetratricopeptide repeat-containing sensor histidine kinase [Rufibacter sp. LB8]|nr:tetratricopeptide repeat-containing sensor histidine kinase [Rufibacter sp. LB8]